jgi:YVTN family beta-propeller protein
MRLSRRSHFLIVGSSVFISVSCNDAVRTLPSAVASSAVAADLIVPGSGTWTAGTSMGQQQGVSGVIDGKFYFAAAAGAGPIVMQVYDPGTGSWVAKAQASSRGRTMGAALGGKLYVAGGCVYADCNGLTSNLVEAYDPTTDTWSTVASIPTARHYAASAVIDGKWYVAGGQGNCAPCNTQENLFTTLEVYDPSTNTWTTKASMPATRSSVQGAAVGGKFYVLGADDTPSGYVGHLDVYDPATNSWSELTPMPTPRTLGGAGVVDGIIYYLSGYLKNGSIPSTVEAYDPATDTWVVVAPIPVSIIHARPQDIGGVLHVVGTDGATNTPLQLFTPFEAPAPVLSAPATAHAGVGLPFELPLGFSHPLGASAGPFIFAVRWKHGLSSVAQGKATTDPNAVPVFRHTYSSAGSYTVRATVSAWDGLADTTFTTLVVHGPEDAPVANVVAPAVDEGSDVVLDASTSTDPNSFGLSYAWQFDGVGASVNASAVLVRKNVLRGVHSWRVIVKNSIGFADTATGSVTVSNVAPVGVFKSPLAPVAQFAAFGVSVTGVKDAASDVPTIGVRFNCGSGYGSVGVAKQVVCPGLGQNGTHTVGVKLTDQLGAQREYTAQITIKNKAPGVVITGFEPRTGFANQYRPLFTIEDGPGDGPFSAKFLVNGVNFASKSVAGPTATGAWLYLQTGDQVTVRVDDKYGARGSTTSTFTAPPGSGSFLYVANSNSDDVSVISVATNAVVATIPVGDGPGGIGITPNGAFVYVSNSGSNSVSVIATATNTVVATIPSVGGEPADLVVSPTGAFAYVANQAPGTVTVISTSSNTVVGSVSTGTYTSNVAISPDGNYVYASTWSTAAPGIVKVISTATNTVVASVTAGIYPASMSLTTSGDFGYVTNLGRTVTKIATATNTVAATVTVGTNECGPTPAYCATPGGHGIAVTPSGAFVYVTDYSANTVKVINAATNTVATTINVDPGPTAVAISPNGATAYVAHYGGTTVKAISTATNSVVATITVGTQPIHLVLKP